MLNFQYVKFFRNRVGMYDILPFDKCESIQTAGKDIVLRNGIMNGSLYMENIHLRDF